MGARRLEVNSGIKDTDMSRDRANQSVVIPTAAGHIVLFVRLVR